MEGKRGRARQVGRGGGGAFGVERRAAWWWWWRQTNRAEWRRLSRRWPRVAHASALVRRDGLDAAGRSGDRHNRREVVRSKIRQSLAACSTPQCYTSVSGGQRQADTERHERRGGARVWRPETRNMRDAKRAGETRARARS
eukprot:6209313-Pleurochrysis_carterae.AAC.3